MKDKGYIRPVAVAHCKDNLHKGPSPKWLKVFCSICFFSANDKKYCLVVGLTLLASVEFIVWYSNDYCHRLKCIMVVKAFSSIRWQLTPICNVGRRQSLSKAWQDFQARSRRGNNLQGQYYIVIQVVHHPKQISLFAQRMLKLPTKIFAE